MTFFIVPLMQSRLAKFSSRVNFGVIYYAAMALILVIGNSSTYIIKFVYPAFDDDLMTTNIYWLAGMFFFSLGFLFSVSRKIRPNKYLFQLRMNIILILLSLSIIGTFVAYYYLGFIPFISGTDTGERYTSYGTITIFNRMWSYCVVAAVLSFIYIKQIKPLFISKITIVIAILISFFFLIRMYPFLIFVVIFLLWITFEGKQVKINIIALISVIVLSVGNVYFQDYRTGDDTNALQASGQLNFVQSKIVYDNFNEFGQLKRAINEYKAEPQYGLTFLSIPLGFIPAPILVPFGVSKSEIQSNNSAVLMAKWLQSENSTGIRIGILGELYINFKHYGCIFMFVIGLLVGYLQCRINAVQLYDWRLGFYMIFFAISLYMLIGQIDAIGSLLGNYTILFLILKVLTTKIYKY